MQKLRNMMIALILIIGVFFTIIGLLYNHYSGSVSSNKTEKSITINAGTTNEKIGDILIENNLIKNKLFFKLYLKIFNINNLKAGTYKLNESMTLADIVNILKEGNNYSEEEISITFQEGINMRKIAKIIASNTNNTYDDVMTLVSDKTYLEEVINKYWFIDNSILNSDIYYPLEGYLFPNTYRFTNKDVQVKEIFTKLLNEMESVLNKYKTDIEKSSYSVHELLTLASICELEVNKDSDRSKVVGVFLNRLAKKMSLGSDITTRYAIKLDDTRALTKSEYATVNAYNTRSSTMAGKLPAGPIGMVSKSSIEASIYPDSNNYLYFISNIKTNETFFFTNYNDFSKKDQELAAVNGDY